MKRNNFSLFEILGVTFLIAILAALLLPLFVAQKASAQPAGTNTAGYGVHQFNDSLIAPLTPARTLAEQLARGINQGTSITSSDGTVTNTFSTNYTYSAAPTVVVTLRGTGISTTNDVVSVTTSNFVYKAGAPSITNNWIAVGQ